MIITLGGTPGSGKGTVGRLLAEKLKYRFYSMGDIRRKYAEDHNMTIEELNTQSETDPASDKLVDEYLVKLSDEENIIVDGRLAFHFIPNAYKIFFKVAYDVGAERIIKNQRANEQYASTEEAIEHLKKRVASDKKRYKALYGVDPYDTEANKYDLIVDTTRLTPEEVLQEILTALPF